MADIVLLWLTSSAHPHIQVYTCTSTYTYTVHIHVRQINSSLCTCYMYVNYYCVMKISLALTKLFKTLPWPNTMYHSPPYTCTHSCARTRTRTRTHTHTHTHSILRLHCSTLRLEEGFNYTLVSQACPGFVGADLVALVREASLCAINRSV